MLLVQYQPLDLTTQEEAPVAVNIAPAPLLSFETQQEFVLPAVAQHVQAARTQGLRQFEAVPGALGVVRQHAIAQLLAAVPREITVAQGSLDPEVRRLIPRLYRDTMLRQV